MGLDMYLSVNRYISHYADLAKSETAPSSYREQFDLAEKILDLVEMPAEEHGGSVNVKVTAIYWRKANAIHNWFVTNVQGGADDCGDYEVTREQLDELRTVCMQVLDEARGSKLVSATKLLPPTSGFFFGSTEIDEWYFQDLEHTVKGIERLLDQIPENWDYSFEYSSSW